MTRALVTRIEQLEARDCRRGDAPWHRVIQCLGETEEGAMRRYEGESGRRIAAGDNVILRIIVAPAP